MSQPVPSRPPADILELLTAIMLALVFGGGYTALLAFFTRARRSQSRSSGRIKAKASAPDRVLSDPLAERGIELIRIAGRGAASEVWEAIDHRLGGRRVAVKRRAMTGTPLGLRFRQMLVQEARTSARLNHPNIVQLFDAIEAPDDVLLIFEFVEGRTLTQRILERGRMAPAEVAAVIGPICLGVAFAHARGVVHRDIKPSNVLLSAAGVPKVSDFGIARPIQYEFETTRRIVGSPAYMSPELKRGVVSKQADIYALGACCVEMLAGRMPADLTRLGDALAGVPPGFGAAIARALSPEPQRRPSADEFAGWLASSL